MPWTTEADVVLKQIFGDRLATDDSEYVNSVAYDERRALLRDDQLTEVFFEHPKLPNWLQCLSGESPYELSRFIRFLDLDGDVAIFQGGTGSGKSTFVSRIVDWSRKIFEENDDWPSSFRLNNFMMRIDLQDASQPCNVESVLLDEAGRLISSGLFRQLRRDKLEFVKVYKFLIENDFPDFGHSGGGETVLDSSLRAFDYVVSRLMPPSKWEEDPVLAYSTIEQAISDLPEPKYRFVCRILPLAFFATKIRPLSRPYVLIVDNLDRISLEVQNILFNALHILFHDLRLSWSGLRIILSMRLSSSLDPKAAFKDFEVIPHAAAKPSDIVFFRLTMFFEKLPANDRFQQLSLECQNQLLARVYLLWMLLVNRDAEFSNSLNALAGSNIRNGLAYANDWVIFPNLIEQGEASFSHQSITATVRKLVGNHVCTTIADSLLHGLEQVVASFLNREYVKSNRDLFVDEISKSLFEIARSVYQDTGIFTPEAGAASKSAFSRITPRTITARHTVRSLQSTISNSPVDHPVISRTCLDLLERMAKLRPELIEDYRSLCRETATKLKSQIDKEFVANSKNLGEVVANKKTNAMVTVAEKLLVGTEKLSSSDKKKILNFESREFPEGSYVIPTGKNHYDYCTNLLRGFPGRTSNPINVFTNDGQQFCPSALRLLFLISDPAKRSTEGRAYVPFQTQTLICDFVRQGWDTNVVLATVRNLVRPDCRLIYSGVHDHDDGAEGILKYPTKEIRLSWAGKGYYDFLFSNPTYLQWALQFDGIPVKYQDSSAYDRLRYVLEAFEFLIKEEHARVTQVFNKTPHGTDYKSYLFEHQELSCQSASAELFFRSMRSFLNIIHSNLDQVRRSVNPREFDYQRLLRKWVWLGQMAIGINAELFGTRNDSWQSEIKTCENLIDKEWNVPKFIAYKNRSQQLRDL